MVLRVFFFIAFIICVQTINSQDVLLDKCKTDELMQTIYTKNPAAYKDWLKTIKTFKTKEINNNKSSNPLVTIPVHVIIVHPAGQSIGTGDNLSLDHIISQIDVLNEDFRRVNADTINMPPEFPGDDSDIDFCMASTDPNGNATDGVTRYVFGGNFDNNEFSIKAATGWPREDYLNIWVAGNIGGVLGYAYVPSSGSLPNSVLDGVVCWTPAFGGPGYATHSTYNLGRTVTHEVGHYLGLNHVWGSGSGGCGQDDGISDTPVSNDKYFGCPSHPAASCGSNDMFMNYMDYVDDDCMNSYTTLQGDYMHLILNTSRSSLLNSAVTNCTLGPPLSGVILNQSDLNCNGDFSGWIEAEAQGGAVPYTYTLNGGTPQSSGLFTGLPAGFHEIIITDDNGSTINLSTTLTEPEALVLTNDGIQDVSCFSASDGFIIVSGSGGTPDYSYNINGGNFQSTGFFQNLPGGTYLVSVKDANACVQLLAIQVQEPNPLILTTIAQENVSCFGDSSGSVDLSSFGGNGNYQYSFDGSPFSSQTAYENLPAGEYSASNIDAKGCMDDLLVIITEPDSLELIVSEIISPQCAGDSTGSVSLTALGGTGLYEFSIDGINFSGQTQFNNLTSGTYSFYVRDDLNCITTIELAVTDAGNIEMSLSSLGDILCFGDATGAISIDAEGGVPAYSYSLDGSIFQSDSIFHNIGAGTYAVYVQDDENCISIDSIEIVGPAEVSINSISSNPENCSALNGSITMDALGGTSPIMYSIDGVNYFESGSFKDLESGPYLVYAKDNNDCLIVTEITVDELNDLTLNNPELTHVSCFGVDDGSILLNETGAFGNAMYRLNEGPYQESGLFSNLVSGIYLAQVIDEANCEFYIEVEITAPPAIEIINSTLTGADCGVENGTASFEGIGGTGSLFYSLDGVNYSSNSSFTDLTAGIHNLSVIDASGCEQIFMFEIEQISDLSINTIIKQDPLCPGENSGSITVNASGGIGDLMFSIDGINFFSSNQFETLEEDSYIVSVIDVNGCLDEQLINLIAPSDIEAEIVSTLDYNCDGILEGTLTFTLEGGTSPYIVKIGGEEVASPIDASFFEFPGTYLLKVVDDNLCPMDEDISIEIPTYEVLEITLEDIVPDSGNADGKVDLGGIGGNAPYTYSSDGINFSANSNFENLAEGNYTFFIMDADGCIEDITVMLGNTATLDSSAPNMEVYPNPFNHKFIIQFETSTDISDWSIDIYSLDGKKLLFDQTRINQSIEIDMKNYSAEGFILVKLYNEASSTWLKVISIR